jgi:hypothetical protein
VEQRGAAWFLLRSSALLAAPSPVASILSLRLLHRWNVLPVVISARASVSRSSPILASLFRRRGEGPRSEFIFSTGDICSDSLCLLCIFLSLGRISVLSSLGLPRYIIDPVRCFDLGFRWSSVSIELHRSQHCFSPLPKCLLLGFLPLVHRRPGRSVDSIQGHARARAQSFSLLLVSQWADLLTAAFGSLKKI